MRAYGIQTLKLVTTECHNCKDKDTKCTAHSRSNCSDPLDAAVTTLMACLLGHPLDVHLKLDSVPGPATD